MSSNIRYRHSYGLMRAWVNTVIWSILGFWIFSIYLNTYNTNKKYKNIFAKVLNTNCKKILIKTVNKNKKVVGTEVKYNCLLKVEYKINNTKQTNQIITFEKLMYDYGSPGKVFQLDEKSMEEYLEKLENEGKNFVFNRGAGGLRQITKVKKISEVQLLKNCYKRVA